MQIPAGDCEMMVPVGFSSVYFSRPGWSGPKVRCAQHTGSGTRPLQLRVADGLVPAYVLDTNRWC